MVSSMEIPKLNCINNNKKKYFTFKNTLNNINNLKFLLKFLVSIAVQCHSDFVTVVDFNSN